MIKTPLRAALLATALACAGTAGASTLVIGGGPAKDCSTAALSGRSDSDSVTTCTLALETQALSFGDRARTYVNRGVLQMRQRDYDRAVKDFDAASRIDPKLGEAFVNRGAAYVGTQRYDEALRQIDQGLDLGVRDPQKALFNRAVAHESLGDLTAAYRDFSKASELDPTWDAPKNELARFTVKQP